MIRTIVVILPLLFSASVASEDVRNSLPEVRYEVAQTHELKPHRRSIPMDGVSSGLHQLHLTLEISPAGDVTKAEAAADSETLRYWPRVEGEVYQWKFTPFEKGGKPIAVEIEEYVDLVPPERLPKTHVAPPEVKPDSVVHIRLQRSGCFGSCPSYTLTVGTDGITFQGDAFVVASGTHKAAADESEVRNFAKQFVAADFYSMDPFYRAAVTDCPTYVVSVDIDGQQHQVVDYMGQWIGMPQVVSQLEQNVDDFTRSSRWIAGTDGLVEALQTEKFNFQTFEAQTILKSAAQRGQADTVQALIDAGVPLKPLPAPKPKDQYTSVIFEHVGWLTAASRSMDTLKVLISARASKEDQTDKDLALADAADSGNVEAVRALVAYGANPNADLTKLIASHSSGGMTYEGQGAGSILISAAASGNPDVVRELLRYQPSLEARDREGKTAMFAAVDSRDSDADGARVECVRLLAEAGADVNARDRDGETPLHETFLTDVEEELLKLGADVNARDNDGETPIFTTVDDDAIPLFITHGADLTIRNKKGQTAFEAASIHGPHRGEVLRRAVANLKTH